MKYDFEFKLARSAQYAGGDRYEYSEKGKPDFMVIYIPQTYSRPMGHPLSKVLITVTNILGERDKDTTEE